MELQGERKRHRRSGGKSKHGGQKVAAVENAEAEGSCTHQAETLSSSSPQSSSQTQAIYFLSDNGCCPSRK